MHIPHLDIHEAQTLSEASSLMTKFAPDARMIAGGTDLLVDLKSGRVSVGHVVSISRIADLRGVSADAGGLRIGALTTITQLDRSPIVRERFRPILDATSQMAAVQIRNVATVGGNLASAVPCADLPPILMAMNASVNIWSPDGERSVRLDAFFVGPRRTVVRDREVLTAILVPDLPDGFGAAYARFSLRDGNAISVAGVAAGLLLDNDTPRSGAGDPGSGTGDEQAATLNPPSAVGPTVREARVVLGAVAPIPKLVEAAGDCLVGKALHDDTLNAAAHAAMAAAEPISDIRGSAAYRRELVGILTRRALAGAWRRAKEPR